MIELERFWSVLLESPKINTASITHTNRRRARKGRVYTVRSPIRTATPALMVFAVLIVAVVAVKSTTSFLASPLQGVIASVIPGLYQPDGIDMRPVAATNEYASFVYPRGMQPRAGQTPHEPFVVSYNLVNRSLASWHVAVSIVRVPSGNLSDNSAYKLRHINPGQYAESHMTLHGQPVTVMTAKDAGGYARVGFIVHGQYQAVVAVTGADQGSAAGLQSTFTMVLESWHWNKS